MKAPVVIERTFKAPIERVWKALTNKNEMRQWYFDIEDFEPKIGFEFKFLGGNEGRKFAHLCEITELVPCKKLSHTWQYEGFEGTSVVSFELLNEKSGTLLRLMHAGLETFPENNPDFARENFVAGWIFIIGSSLKNFLEKNQ